MDPYFWFQWSSWDDLSYSWLPLIIVKKYYILIHIFLCILELGQSSCRYSGNHHPNDTACYVDAFEISKLPTNECTSYIYDGITCTDDSKIVPNYSPDDLSKKILQF